MENEEDLNYLKYKTEELNRELIEKLNKINALNEQNKNKELLIQTLKKTINSQNEKLALTEKIRAQMSFQNKQIEENEMENNLIKTEYM
jgi:DNA polymerase III alpha subunit